LCELKACLLRACLGCACQRADPKSASEADDEEETRELQALAIVVPFVAGSWGLAGLAAGTAWARLSWELDAMAALSTQLADGIPSSWRTAALHPHSLLATPLAAWLPESCAPALRMLGEVLHVLVSGNRIAAAVQMLPGAATAAIAAALVAASERCLRARLRRLQRPAHSPLASAVTAALMPALGSTSALLSALLGVAYCGGGGRGGRAGAVTLGRVRGRWCGLGLEAVSLCRAWLAQWVRKGGEGRGLVAWVAGASLLGGAISTVRTYRCLVRACEALSVLPSRVEYGVCVYVYVSECMCVCVCV